MFLFFSYITSNTYNADTTLLQQFVINLVQYGNNSVINFFLAMDCLRTNFGLLLLLVIYKIHIVLANFKPYPGYYPVKHETKLNLTTYFIYFIVLAHTAKQYISSLHFENFTSK